MDGYSLLEVEEAVCSAMAVGARLVRATDPRASPLWKPLLICELRILDRYHQPRLLRD